MAAAVVLAVAATIACGGPSASKDIGAAQPATSDAQPAQSAGSTDAGRGTDATKSTASSKEADTIVAEVQQKIRSDPRITSQQIQVSFDHGQITLMGSVATDDERTAAVNNAIKVTDLPVLSSLGVVPAQPDVPSGEWSEPSASGAPTIPLCPGLTVVTAIASQGDYESIKTIESVDSRNVRLKYSSESSPPWWSDPHPQLKRMTTHRTVLTSDLESAHRYDQIFVGTETAPETAPGTTAIGTSAAVLRDLKTKGETEIGLCGAADDAQVMDANRQLHPVPGGCYNFMRATTIKRVGTGPSWLRVLVNGAPVDLPAVQARGKYGFDTRMEFFFLDDERNPLTLSFRLGIGSIPALPPRTRQQCENEGKKGLLTLMGASCDLPDGGDADVLRVVKITTRCDAPAAKLAGGSAAGAPQGGASTGGASALEKSLADTGKADVYSIYFSFNSDAIREESEPTLEEIANVLRRHRDWQLRIAGHTDGIGGDQQNLDLSQRRAAAVKNALVKGHGIGAGLLSTTGFGKSQPKDTNDTLEGRARNRRVELQKVG
jgi:outer membrane protein OmpA-like peptidoglycan-associated protein